MALTSEDRLKVRRGITWYLSQLLISTSMSKAEFLATVVAADEWIDDHQGDYNSSLPAVAQAELSLAQKTFIFCLVAAARVSLDFLRKLVGRVD